MTEFRDAEVCNCGTLKGEIDAVLAALQRHLATPETEGCAALFTARVIAYTVVFTALDGVMSYMAPHGHAKLADVVGRLSQHLDTDNLTWVKEQVQAILEADMAKAQGIPLQ